VTRAAAILGTLNDLQPRPIIVDVGSGGGWAARYLNHSDVIAIDLIEIVAPPAIAVRGDMRRLPVRSSAVDGMLFAASLHYAPVSEVIPEIARVLRTGGLLVAVDSPIYASPRLQQEARARSATYYARSGFPELLDRYHPIESRDLQNTLTHHGMRIKRLETEEGAARLWRRLVRTPRSTLVAAEKVG
jgi:SAM-dependent methyltransferase